MQQIEDLVSKRIEVVGPFGIGPKPGAQKSILASLFPFWHLGNYSRGGKNGVLVTKLSSGSGQANLRFGHLQFGVKQQLLRSKDRNRNCSCRDSDVEIPVPLCSFLFSWAPAPEPVSFGDTYFSCS